MWWQLQLTALLLSVTPSLMSGSEESDDPPLKYLAPFNPDWQLAIELGHAVPTFQNLNFGCNASMLGDAYAATQVPGFLSLEDCMDSIWDYSSARKDLNLTGLHPKWRSELTTYLHSALPLFHSGALLGVFLGDEMMCSKIPYSNYSAVAGAVRQWLNAASLKDVLIYSNECSQPLVRGGEVWSIPAKLPVELDLFSIDLYSARSASKDPTAELTALKKMVEDHMRPRLHPHQKLMLVPGLFGDRQTHRSGTHDEQQEFLLAKLNATVDWAKSDPDVIGIIPWHWLSPPPSYPIYTTIYGLGIESFPKLIGRLNALGKEIAEM